MEINIKFNAVGWFDQTIEITHENYKHLSKEEILDNLEQGVFITTVQEGGDVVTFETANGETKMVTIGKVVSSDSNCDYSDFEDPDEPLEVE